MVRHRLAASVMAFGLGAAALLANVGGALAVAPPTLNAAAVVGVACGTIPLDVEIILDTSGSMGSNSSAGQTRLYWAQHAADQLVDQLQGNGGVGTGGIHEVGLTTFSGTTSTVRLALGASDATTVKNAINATTASGNTPFKTGMATGAADMTSHKRTTVNGLTVKHVIIFLSDGRPNPDQGPNGAVATSTSGERPTQANLNSFKAAADAAYSIAIGSGGSGSSAVDLGLMQLLAKSDGTSGGYFNVVDASLLPTLFSTIFQQIACVPSIVVTKTSDHATAAPGDTVNYTITVQNIGNGAATSVPVSDSLAWLGSFGAYNNDCTGSCSNNSGTLTWSIASIAPGDTVTLKFSVTLASSFPIGVTSLTNAVVVEGSNCAANSTDSKCTTTTTVTVEASPSPEISASPSPEVSASPPPEVSASPTAVVTASPSPFESFGGETAYPSASTTTPPTSSSGGSGSSSTPLMALLICLAFGALGLLAVESQRRSAHR